MRYTAYKPLDELWLTTIPSHWQARKIKYLFSERSEKGYPDEPLLVASQNMGVVPKDVYGNRTVEATKDLHLLKLVRIGDFVISLRSFQGGLEHAHYQGIISPAYTIIVPNELLTSGYFRYLAKSRLFIELLQMCVTGIREGQNIDYTKLKNHQIPVPPREEQDQIVRYLDWQVSKINKLISARKKQIVLLKEQKQAVINKAVTKGLDPNVPMKDSGVEWIGEIPLTWDIKRIRELFSQRNMKASDKEFAALSVAKVGIVPQLDTAVKTDNGDNRKLVCAGDFVINSRSDRKGSCGVSPLDGSVSLINIVLIPHKDWNGSYVHYLLRSSLFSEEYYRNGRGIVADLWTTRYSEMKTIMLPVPPLKEQNEIVRHLDSQVSKTDMLIIKLEEQIALLVEYRTRLTSDVVTGQIDVLDIEVPEFEYIADEADDVSDDENTDLEEIMEEEE
jgi:type I restriction enzyme S subunit